MKRYLLVLLAAVAGVVLFVQSASRTDLAKAADEAAGFFYLPVIFRNERTEFDMAVFMTGDGRLYEVQHSSGSQARHQTQFEDIRFFHTKGNDFKAEWEELWVEDGYIMRGTDTSPGNNQYYTLRDIQNGEVGSRWSPRFWRVGDLYERFPHVTFYNKDNCQMVANGWQQSWLLFEAHYDQYTFPDPPGGATAITLNDVVQLAWLLHPGSDPIESYFYAKDYGLVGWGSNDRGFSYISEIHQPGARPDNNREVIGCLQSTLGPLDPRLPLGPLPWPYRAK
jgi:hypothetical protein